MNFEMKPTKKNERKYQVRFWCSETLYKKFKEKCDNNSVNYGDAFAQLMEFFLRSQKP